MLTSFITGIILGAFAGHITSRKARTTTKQYKVIHPYPLGDNYSSTGRVVRISRGR